MNNIKQELLTDYEHINTYLLFFIYFVDVNGNQVSGGNQIKQNYLKKSNPNHHGRILKPNGNKDATNPRNRVYGRNQNR